MPDMLSEIVRCLRVRTSIESFSKPTSGIVYGLLHLFRLSFHVFDAIHHGNDVMCCNLRGTQRCRHRGGQDHSSHGIQSDLWTSWRGITSSMDGVASEDEKDPQWLSNCIEE